jgi:hypothetical protein
MLVLVVVVVVLVLVVVVLVLIVVVVVVLVLVVVVLVLIVEFSQLYLLLNSVVRLELVTENIELRLIITVLLTIGCK